MQDMIDLAFLHEPGVLWNLKQRYLGHNIYTYTGSILIAVNPFQSLPGLYGKTIMDSYSSGDTSMLPPHVYAIAAAAYKKMRQEGRGQAILVGGAVVGPGCCWKTMCVQAAANSMSTAHHSSSFDHH